MINKSFYIIMFVYAVNGGLLTAQYVIATPLGITLTDQEGNPLEVTLVEISDTTEVNRVFNDINARSQNQTVDGYSFDPIFEFNAMMAFAINTAFPLLTGTYVFFIMNALGIPEIVVITIGVMYTFFLVRTLIGLLRGF